MADRSAIEWTDATWNPVRARNRATGRVGWHCVHASAGCANCYAERWNIRLGTKLPYKPGHEPDIEIYLDEASLLQPLRWRRARKVFVGSMTDLFADFVGDAMLDPIFAVMALAPQHTFQVLTKRPARMRAYLSDSDAHRRISSVAVDVWLRLTTTMRGIPSPGHVSFDRHNGCDVATGPWPLPNVWLGTSCEDQATADARIPDLLATPAAVRFVSAEPLLGPIDFNHIQIEDEEFCAIDALSGSGLFEEEDRNLGAVPGAYPALDGIFVGGESGPKARPMHPIWATSVRDQCATDGVPFFFKQWGEYEPGDDVIHDAVVGPGGHPCRQLAFMRRVGKRRAGRRLDGREHNDLPERAP